MKIYLICGIFLAGFAASAAPEFSGHWQGTGTFQTGGMPVAASADFDIVLKQTEQALVIDQCWTVASQKSCYRSQYVLNAALQILKGDRKIGDIFPGRVSIFQGNSQVSELMSFELNGRRDLRFRYSYSNFDGDLNVQFAQLPEVAAP